MDSKLKIKYRKNEKKYIVDYSKVENREEVRYDLYQQLNSKEAIMILMDTSLNKVDPKKIQTCFYDLKDEDSFKIVEHFLEESDFDYKLKKVNRNVPRTILGFNSGRSDLVEDILIAVFIPINGLNRELFDYLLCTHDVMVGIKPTTAISSMFTDFLSGKFQRINEVKGFEHTLVDSHMMEYFYTDYEFE